MQGTLLRQNDVDLRNDLIAEMIDLAIGYLQDRFESGDEIEDSSDFMTLGSSSRDC
jgi:hypothetical protein